MGTILGTFFVSWSNLLEFNNTEVDNPFHDEKCREVAITFTICGNEPSPNVKFGSAASPTILLATLALCVSESVHHFALIITTYAIENFIFQLELTTM